MPKILNTLFYLLYFKLSMKIYLIKINAPKLIYWSILVAFFLPGWCDDINCYPFVYWVNGLKLLSCEIYLPGEWNLQYTLQKRERSFLVCWLYSVNKNWYIDKLVADIKDSENTKITSAEKQLFHKHRKKRKFLSYTTMKCHKFWISCVEEKIPFEFFFPKQFECFIWQQLHSQPMAVWIISNSRVI